MFRSGFVSFVGRPNVGKSTLTNALVGQKIAITSPKPQTTRRAIRGVVTDPTGQIIIVDTPGLHRPRTLLGERLNDLVENTLADVDVIGMCIPANEKIGPGDRFIVEQIQKFRRATKVAIVTKAELVSRDQLAAQLLAVDELLDWKVIVPVSAVTEEQLGALKGELIKFLPESEALYPEEMLTDESVEARVCELIREAALQDMREELPHSLAVTLDEMSLDEERDLYLVHANVWVERESQKAMVIGKGAAHIKAVGQRARKELNALLGKKVFLDLQVKVAADWQRDPKQLGKLGF